MKDIHPFVSIVIPVRNGESYLEKCLEALGMLDYPKDRFEVIVADGLSEDNSREIAHKYNIKIINNKKKTSIAGRNIGFKHTRKGELVGFLDADSIVSPDWIKNSIKYFKDRKIGGISGPILIPEEQNCFAKATDFIMQLVTSLRNLVNSDSIGIEHIPTCNAVYSRKALAEVFPIDETLIAGEDIMIGYYVRKRGYKLLPVSDVCVWHYRREKYLELWKQMCWYGVTRAQIFKRLQTPLGFLIVSICIVSFLFLFIYPSVSLLIFILGLLLTKSFYFSFNNIIALFIMILAWNLGFLKEMLYPYVPK